ncbi:MAG: DUF2782 domain-containing protein [Gammaproteobacteria bacterium]
MMIPYRTVTFLTTIFILPVNASFADVAPPPPLTKENQQSQTPKKSIPLETPAVKQDKPDEQQPQFPTPELVIRYKDGAKIEEYRVNGQLRYSKITPSIGPPYYLVDTDGDGIFDKRHDHLANPPIQQWLLYSW